MTTLTSLQQVLTQELEAELNATRRIFERVPDEHFAWQPHAKSTSLGNLASHIADLFSWLGPVLQASELDLAAATTPAPAASRAELLSRLADNGALAQTALAAATADDFEQTWTLRYGDHVIFQQARFQIMRHLVLSHLIHHRGQLTVYLRLLEVPLPNIYGPTADEQ